MFDTIEVKTIYKQSLPATRSALNLLNNSNFSKCKIEIQNLNELVKKSKEAYSLGDDDVLNELYVLERYIDLLSSYRSLWEKILAGEFSSSWQTLQNILDLLRTIKKFTRQQSKILNFLENQLQNLEKLYPYKIFLSVGFTVDRFDCSICGKDIDSMNCIHLVGELYMGDMAYGVAKNITKFDHVSFVSYPEDKRCVIRYDDNGEDFKVVRYLSSLVLSGKLKPFDFGELKFSKKKSKNSNYRKIGRNALCYCDSGKKFKKCCISNEFVENDHVDILIKPTNIVEVFG